MPARFPPARVACMQLEDAAIAVRRQIGTFDVRAGHPARAIS
jgi:hypothetical protein